MNFLTPYSGNAPLTKNLFLKQAIILFLLIFLSFGNIVAQKPTAILDSCIKRLSEIKSGELDVTFSMKANTVGIIPFSGMKQSVQFYNTGESIAILETMFSIKGVTKDGTEFRYDPTKKQYSKKDGNSSYGHKPYNFWISGGKALKGYITADDYVIEYAGREKIEKIKYFKYRMGHADMEDTAYLYIHPISLLPDIFIDNNEVVTFKFIMKPKSLYKEVDSAIYENINKTYDKFREAYYKQSEEVRNENDDTKDTTISVAPLWSLPTLAGDTLHFENVTSKLVLLDFWFVNCKPCLSAIKTLVKLDSVYNDSDLQIIGLNVVDTSISKMRQIVNTYHIKYPIVHQAGDVSDEYAVSSYPTLFLIDTQSKKVLYKHRGYNMEMREKLEKTIEKALKKGN